MTQREAWGGRERVCTCVCVHVCVCVRVCKHLHHYTHVSVRMRVCVHGEFEGVEGAAVKPLTQRDACLRVCNCVRMSACVCVCVCPCGA